MTKPMFKDRAAEKKMADWFETFRSAIGFPTESRVVETTVGRTHVLIAGPPDGEPLVCLHGALATSAHLLPELGGLVDRYRIYAIDVMGQSVMSENRRLALDDDSYGHWLREVTTGLGLERFALFGVSWGGFVALRAARATPEAIRALVLLVPAGLVAGSAWAGFTKIGWPMFTYRLAPSDDRLQRLVSALFSSADAQWTKYFGDAVLAYRLDMRIPPLLRPADVANYTGPTLILGADEDVSFPGGALVARARELFPRAEIELLENCKHCPPTGNDFRARTAKRIGTFLAEASKAAILTPNVALRV
jgi:2-hydroxy-6-oxonona-2,4-dienedioate hydrolase